MSAYNVQLVGLNSVDYDPATGQTSRTVGLENAKFYNYPSEMSWNWCQVKKKAARSNDTYHLTNFALQERVILSSRANVVTLDVVQNVPRPSGSFPSYKKRALISENFRSPPEIFCNITCLKALMTFPKKADYFKASRIRLDDEKYCVYVTCGFKEQFNGPPSLGLRMEDFLSSGNKDCVINHDHVLEAIYQAQVNGTNEVGFSRQIQIGFTAETDGLWKRGNTLDLNQENYRLQDLVEVKCLDHNVFFKRSHFGTKPFHYEEIILREIWAQSYLRGIDKVLCGVVERQPTSGTLKEMWLYDVNQIPRVVGNMAANTRCFPKIEFTNLNDRDKKLYNEWHAKTYWKKWTKEVAHQSLYNSLDTILRSYLKDEPDSCDTKYFVHDSLSQMTTNSISEITNAAYYEPELNQRALFVHIHVNCLKLGKDEILKEILNVFGKYSTVICRMKRRQIQCAELGNQVLKLTFQNLEKRRDFFNASKQYKSDVSKPRMKITFSVEEPLTEREKEAILIMKQGGSKSIKK